MYHAHHLIINGQQYDITNCIKNWDDLVQTIVRNNYDGLEHNVNSKFEFVGQAYTLIQNEYESKRLRSNATVIFSLRNNSWLFNEKFRCRLDFSEYEDDGFVITMGGIDSSMKSVIKANGGTEYEINVDDVIAGEGDLVYDGLEIQQSAKWVITGESVDDSEAVTSEMTGGTYGKIPLYITGTPEVLHKNTLMFNNVDASTFSFAHTLSVPLKIKFVINFKFKGPTGSVATVHLRRINADESIRFWRNAGTDFMEISETVEYTSNSLEDYFSLACYVTGAGAKAKVEFINIDSSAMKVYWNDRRTSSIMIDIINPETLLNALLHKMTGKTDSVGTISTAYDTRIQNTMLCAAESIRGIEGAKIYTSFNKFRDWMKSVFGYVYEISGDNVTFRHRRAYFDKNTVVKSIDRYSGYNYSINSGIIYSRVKAGFEEQDYEEVNGRDEFRFGTTFSTGVTLTNTELSLISPYRADAIGFEILADKRGKDTTDNSSDKNIFMIGVARNTTGSNVYGYYMLDRTINDVLGLISPTTQFNLMFTPRRCIEANKAMIGACTKDLTFASSEGNSDVVINGVSQSGNVSIADSERIFEVGIIKVTIADIDVPDNIIGVVEVERNGKIKRGFIEELDFAQGKRKETTYQLIEIAD